MTWLIANPMFTWLLPAAALPVLFHLFFKLKKRPRVFPTLMFFDQIDPQLSARRQIRHWLVLLLRTLFLLFLLLALARPVWLIGGGTGRVAVVCLIDNSGSMSGRADGDRSKLHSAVEAVHALVSKLTGKDTAAVLTLVDDPTVALPPGLESDKALIQAALDRIVETEATGDLAAAWQHARALLEASVATRYEIHIFTDLQEAKWNRTGGGLQPPRAGTTVVIHRFASPAAGQPNLSLAGIALPPLRLLAARPIPLQIMIANPGLADATARLNWVDEADNRGTTEITVPHQSEKNFPVLIKPAQAGFHWFQAWLEGDSFAADNKAALGFVCAEKSTVLFAGQTNDFGLLPLAMTPAASGLTAAFGFADKPVLIVTPWDKAGTFQNFVELGGNLLVVPSLTATDGVRPPAWLGVACDALTAQPAGAPVMIFRDHSIIFTDLRDPAGQVTLRGIKAFKFQPLRPANDQDSVFGLEDGRALFVEHPVGKGLVFASGLAFDPAWTTLPLKGAFLAIAQGMALAHAPGADNTVALIAGERLAGTGAEPAEIKSLAGSPLDWRGESGHLPVLPRSGIYTLKTGQTKRSIAVRCSAAEGQARFLTGPQVPRLAGIPHTVRNFTDLTTFLRQSLRISRGLDLFLPLLLLAMFMVLLEVWFANPAKRIQ